MREGSASEDVQFAVAEERDIAEACVVIARAFAHDPQGAETWIRERATLEQTRVLRLNGRVAATAIRVPMGIYLGGQSMPQVGIAGVAVAPELRGRGLARWLMRRLMADMRDRGEHLSTLYSAMHPLYRSTGYETAGHLYRVRIPAGLIVSTDRGAGWRAYAPADRAAVEACARARASGVAGALDRGPYVWHRVFEPRIGKAEAFVADDGAGGVEAYCVYHIERTPEDDGLGNASGWKMSVIDLGYQSARGLERLLGFLAGFSSVVGVIELCERPSSPLLLRLPDRRYTVAIKDSWMLRLVDPREAMAARAYPKVLSGSIGFSVDDPVFGEQEPFVLEIHNGRGLCRTARHDEPTLRVRVRDLAAMFTGFHSASQLAMLGQLHGTRDAIEMADVAFACAGGPCMFDFF